jgi:hypothetical protein
MQVTDRYVAAFPKIGLSSWGSLNQSHLEPA